MHHPGSMSTIEDVASAHPAARTPDPEPPFHVVVDDDRVVLIGSVDTFQAEQLADALAGSGPRSTAVLDLCRLEFVDVAGCRVIARWAGDLCTRGVPVEIRGASHLFRRVWRVLTLGLVASVTFTEVSA